MARRVMFCLFGIGILTSFLISGCGSQAEMGMNFAADRTATYKVNVEVIKDFKFEQPSLEKSRAEQTGTKIETVFEEKITGVEADGSADAEITIKAIKYYVSEKNEVKFDFDSAREADKKDPFANLVGKSYKIKIDRSGAVSVVDAASIRNVVKSGYSGRVAKSYLADKSIIKRHEILALPAEGVVTKAAGDTWSKIEASPPGLLEPKSYEKVYTLNKVEGSEGNRKIYVTMNAVESAVPAEDLPTGAGSLGPFAKMFDVEEQYAGEMVLGVDTGVVDKYAEKLVVKYVVAEASAQQKPDKGPDTLTIGFTHSISREKVD